MSTDLKIWSRFSKMKNGTEVKFMIQEVSKEKYKEVLKLFLKYYVPEEPVHKAADVTANDASLKEFNRVMLQILHKEPHQIDVCYLDDGSDELKVVGGSIMVIEKREDPPLDLEQFKAETKEVKDFFKLVQIIVAACDVIKDQNVDSNFADCGVVVDHEYRGLGIAGEIFKARVEACKAYNVPITSAWMTSIGTQKAAAKLGWETICELSYEELGREAGVTFKDGPATCKLMMKRVPE